MTKNQKLDDNLIYCSHCGKAAMDKDCPLLQLYAEKGYKKPCSFTCSHCKKLFYIHNEQSFGEPLDDAIDITVRVDI